MTAKMIIGIMIILPEVNPLITLIIDDSAKTIAARFIAIGRLIVVRNLRSIIVFLGVAIK